MGLAGGEDGWEEGAENKRREAVVGDEAVDEDERAVEREQRGREGVCHGSGGREIRRGGSGVWVLGRLPMTKVVMWKVYMKVCNLGRSQGFARCMYYVCSL